MTGKAYTMREMKSIVDYLKTHKYYSQTRSRKMWMDLANTSLTNRTWQSLKETFLKRILPDIHNPYYGLTLEQICSFKQRQDVGPNLNNKLEIYTISDNSSNADHEETKEQPGTSNNIRNGENAAKHCNNGENTTGESKKIDSRNRASTETLVLEPCNDSIEEQLRDMESPVSEKDECADKNQRTKTLRDFITYAEPLTPMLQEVLDDFATDESGEHELEIVEKPASDAQFNKDEQLKSNAISNSDNNESKTITKQNVENQPIEVTKSNDISNSDNNDSITKTNEKVENQPNKVTDDTTHFSNIDKLTKEVSSNPSVDNTAVSSNNISPIKETSKESVESEHNKLVSNKNNSNVKSQESDIPANKTTNVEVLNANVAVNRLSNESKVNTQTCSNSTTDSTLPGNQEALKTSETNKKNNDSLSIPGNQEALKITESEKTNTDTLSIPDMINKGDKKKLALTRKRANSHTSQNAPKETYNSKQKSISEAGSGVEDRQVDFKIPLKRNKHSDKKNHSTITQNLEIDDMKINKQTDMNDANKDKKINDKGNNNQDSSEANPCLDSVSLYAEQLNKTKYTDSESNDSATIAANEKEDKIPKIKKTLIDVSKVVVLRSESDSDSDMNKGNEKTDKIVSKTQRDRALASVFGFSSGAVTKSRNRKLSCHRPSISRHYQNSSMNLESSEWTSESNSEYVSPPRGRKNRQTRKYLKPNSARIISLEEEGGLFVVHGKRIYPLVKDGKIIKNYLTYSPESDPEEDSSHWKKKYEEERKKTEELKKLLNEVKDIQRESSPILPLTTLPKPSMSHALPSPHKPDATTTNNSNNIIPVKPKEDITENKHEKTLKIKFIKNNEELQLEGHWSHIHPVLSDVVQLFNKDADPPKAMTATRKSVASDDVVSVVSTHIDEEVHEKVAQLEEEIFQEIQERDKEDQPAEVVQDTNVTKRKRTLKSRKSSEQSTGENTSKNPTQASKRKKTKDDTSHQTELLTVPAEQIAEDVDNIEIDNAKMNVPEPDTSAVENTSPSNGVKQRTRSPKKSEPPTVSDIKETSNKVNTRKSSMKQAESKDVNEDFDVRYMFPPNNRKKRRQIVTYSKAKTQNSSRSQSQASKINNLKNLSIESTQGYQDSDGSPAKERLLLKRKRKLSLSTALHGGKNRHRYVRKKSHPYVDDASSESSNLSFILPAKTNTNSTLNSEAYRSESYQLLMQKGKLPLPQLDKIDELSVANETNLNEHYTNLDIEIGDVNEHSSTSSRVTQNDCFNSSNVSFPMSPELSVVEKISINKELLNSLENRTLNEIQANNNTAEDVDSNKYMMSEVDVTMPLMEQDCDIHKSVSNSCLGAPTTSIASETMLNKINTANVTDAPTISDSLDSRLKNLLLESAKKMEIDATQYNDIKGDGIDVDKVDQVKKTRAKKRCSTPRKRKGTLKSKTPNIEAVVEEEQMEFCIRQSRNSCPPSIQILSENQGGLQFNEHNNNSNEQVNLSKSKETKTKGRQKKDVIKVKILKPKANRKSKHDDNILEKKSQDYCSHSVQTDSGINESASAFLQSLDESIDLIHNHSETCLQAKECINNSVEFIEPAMESVISLNTNSSQLFDQFLDVTQFRDAENIPPEMFSNDAHDGMNMKNAKSMKLTNSQPTSDTTFYSPEADMTSNSLMTEDLSNESPVGPFRTSKWYLFSEDETTNTNHVPNFRSNLKQLFPIACAVPDLSTITEMSKENEDSRKRTLECDSDTRNDLDSRNTF